MKIDSGEAVAVICLTATGPVNGNVETKDIVSVTLTSEQLM